MKLKLSLTLAALKNIDMRGSGKKGENLKIRFWLQGSYLRSYLESEAMLQIDIIKLEIFSQWAFCQVISWGDHWQIWILKIQKLPLAKLIPSPLLECPWVIFLKHLIWTLTLKVSAKIKIFNMQDFFNPTPPCPPPLPGSMISVLFIWEVLKNNVLHLGGSATH